MRFLKLCFIVIPSVFVDFYREMWMALMRPQNNGRLGVTRELALAILSVVEHTAKLLWGIFRVVMCIFANLLAVFLMLLFPILTPVWAPLTAYRVVKHENEVEAAMKKKVEDL